MAYVRMRNCFVDKKLPVIRTTKTMIVTKNQRFRKPNDLKNGSILREIPSEVWPTSSYIYFEDEPNEGK